jgi:O-methyltransferase
MHKLPGDIVECGVWKGGSLMAVAKALIALGQTNRTRYLFDTFEGMPLPSSVDRTNRGEAASDLLKAANRDTAWIWAYSPLEEVKRVMANTGYESRRTVFVPGKVEDTIPANAPVTISLLRLDTDWYDSTYHELKHLYPRLSVGGVLIVDDYGHWEGARRVVEHDLKVLLSRIDYTGRVCVKLRIVAGTLLRYAIRADRSRRAEALMPKRLHLRASVGAPLLRSNEQSGLRVRSALTSVPALAVDQRGGAYDRSCGTPKLRVSTCSRSNDSRFSWRDVPR